MTTIVRARIVLRDGWNIRGTEVKRAFRAMASAGGKRGESSYSFWNAPRRSFLEWYGCYDSRDAADAAVVRLRNTGASAHVYLPGYPKRRLKMKRSASPKSNRHKPPLYEIQFDDIGCPILSSKWTPEERLAAVSFLVVVMTDDFRSGRFGSPGRVNTVSMQSICYCSAYELERWKVRDGIKKYASELRLRLVRATLPPVQGP